jgi:lipopolysaccharide/colanic/teichoic acid biosynthesis glycosyltransferase
MIVNAENNGAVFTTVNDNRITSFGKFFKKTRIDEIPQCINILKGEMAVVGPRPERPNFVRNSEMPFYETRHVMRLSDWGTRLRRIH